MNFMYCNKCGIYDFNNLWGVGDKYCMMNISFGLIAAEKLNYMHTFSSAM